MAFKKRGKLEIIYPILKCCRSRASRTRIAYSAYVNFKSSTKYLDMLIEKGILEEVRVGDKSSYRLTPKGVRLLYHLEHVMKILETEDYL